MVSLNGLAKTVSSIVVNLISEQKESDLDLSNQKISRKKELLNTFPTPEEISQQFSKHFNIKGILSDPKISESIRVNPLFRMGLELVSLTLLKEALRRSMGGDEYSKEAKEQGTRAYKIDRRIDRIIKRFDDLNAASFKDAIEDICIKQQLSLNTLQNKSWIGTQLSSKLPKIVNAICQSLPTPRFKSSGEELIEMLTQNNSLSNLSSPLGSLLSRTLLMNLTGSFNGVRSVVNEVLGSRGGLFGRSTEGAILQLTYGKLSKHFIRVEISQNDLKLMPRGTIACYQSATDLNNLKGNKSSFNPDIKLKTENGWVSSSDLNPRQNYGTENGAVKILAFIPQDFLKLALEHSSNRAL